MPPLPCKISHNIGGSGGGGTQGMPGGPNSFIFTQFSAKMLHALLVVIYLDFSACLWMEILLLE